MHDDEDGDERHEYGYEPIAIACSWTTSFIGFSRRRRRRRPGQRDTDTSTDILASDIIVSFGTNDYHELGIGPVPPSSPPTPHIVAIPSPPAGQVHRIRSLVAGQRHVVCVMDVIDNSASASSTSHRQPTHPVLKRQAVYGWGAARHGQLSIESFLDRVDGSSTTPSSPHHTTAEAGPSRPKPRRPIRGKPPRLDKPKSPQRYPMTIALPRRIETDAAGWATTTPRQDGDKAYVVDVSVGARHTLIHMSTGRVIPLGSTAKSQTAALVVDNDVWSAVGCTWNGSYAVRRTTTKRGDELVSMGSNSHGQLGRADAADGMGTVALSPAVGGREITIKRLACGSEHVLALCSAADDGNGGKNELVAWGWNEHGNLGTGNTVDQPMPVKVMLDAYRGSEHGWEVVRCWAGCGTSWVLLDRRRG